MEVLGGAKIELEKNYISLHKLFKPITFGVIVEEDELQTIFDFFYEQ